MEKIKICEMVDTYYPTVDGVIQVVKHYSNLLSEKSDCVVAAPKPRKKDKYVDNEKFKVLRCRGSYAPEGYRTAAPQGDRKFMKNLLLENFDIIHTHTPFTMGRCAINFGRKYKIPVVSTLHTQYHQDFARVAHGCKLFVKIALKYIVHVYNHSDSVWTVSQKSAEFLRKYGYKGKVTVIRNGTDYRYPAEAEELVQKVNQIHNLEGQKNVFLFVGRMAWYKGIKLICDSMKVLKDKNEDFKMVFVGGGFDLEEVKAYVKKIGIEDKCILTGNISDRKLLQGYYLRSDLMVFPSTFDMASIVKEEAAAHKLACVLVKDSCCAERVVDGENGFLCEENVESLSNMLLELINSPEKMKQAGENAHITLYRTWDDVSKDVYDEYLKIIKEYKENLTEKELVKYNKAKAKMQAKIDKAMKKQAKKQGKKN